MRFTQSLSIRPRTILGVASAFIPVIIAIRVLRNSPAGDLLGTAGWMILFPFVSIVPAFIAAVIVLYSYDLCQKQARVAKVRVFTAVGDAALCVLLVMMAAITYVWVL